MHKQAFKTRIRNFPYYIEFDVPDSQVKWVKNPKYGDMELTIKGGVKELLNPDFVKRK